jgi:hypothetical protein
MRGFNSRQMLFTLALAAIIAAVLAYRWVSMLR